MALAAKDNESEAKHDEEAQEEEAMQGELAKLADAKKDDAPQVSERALDPTEQGKASC